MVANIRGYTPNYSFKLINFDTPRWHTLEYSNWGMVDALLLQSGIPQVRGGWQNNAAYIVGDRTFDEETSATYRCLVEHTSAISGTFAEDRLLHPTYWSLQLSGTPVYRDEWLPNAAYVLGDIVEVDDYAYYLCTLGHTSSADFAADALKWQKVFDATVVVADAEAAKAAAYQFSLNAQGSANDAASSATDAQAAEDNAESWADEARAATGGFRWAFSSSTTAEDPAVGRVAFNNNDPTLVTEMYVSAQSAEIGNPDVSDWLVTWDDSTNVDTRGTIQIRKVGAPEQFLLFHLTGSIVDNGSWLKFTVSYALHSGTVTNGEQLSLGFVRAGDTGPTGTGGGDMLRSNNLSDVVSVPTSRSNLGLGVAQIPTFSQVLLGNAPSADMHAATKVYVDASPSLYISDTAPASVQDGSLWWDSDRGTLLVRYNDGSSTQWVDAVAVPGIDTSSLVKKAGDTMTGSLAIKPATGAAQLALAKPTSGQFSLITGYTNDIARWAIIPGDSIAETGSNTGSDFAIYSYADNGNNLHVPFHIQRSSGLVTLTGATNIVGRLTVTCAGAAVMPVTLKASAATADLSTALLQFVDKNDTSHLYCYYNGGALNRIELFSQSGKNFLIGTAGVGNIYLSAANVSWSNTFDFKGGPVRVDVTGDGLWSTASCAISLRTNGSSNYGIAYHHQLHASVSAYFATAGAAVGSISHSGGTTTAYNTSSDERLKSFSGDYDPLQAIDIIRRNPVRAFTWRSTGEAAVGWSAQASYEVSRDLATPPPSQVKDIAVGEEGFFPWGMDLSKRTPYLWAALSGAWDRIDALEARIAALEA